MKKRADAAAELTVEVEEKDKDRKRNTRWRMNFLRDDVARVRALISMISKKIILTYNTGLLTTFPILLS